MTQSPFLSRSELRELSGRQTRPAIRAWLKVEKIAHVLDADGWPKVARELIARRTGLAEGRGPVQHSEPDFAALKARKVA